MLTYQNIFDPDPKVRPQKIFTYHERDEKFRLGEYQIIQHWSCFHYVKSGKLFAEMAGINKQLIVALHSGEEPPEKNPVSPYLYSQYKRALENIARPAL